MSDPLTDVSRPSALPVAHLSNKRDPHAQSLIEQDSKTYLDNIEEEWNKRVDAEIETLVDGMVDLVGLASVCLFLKTRIAKLTCAQIGDKDKFRIAQESFQAQSRAESMVRAANSLLSITHSMKLLLLLSDEAQIVHRRDTELSVVSSQKSATKQKVCETLNALVKK